MPLLQHYSWECDDVDHVGHTATALYRVDPERQVWGMGRHFAGSNFYWYLRDPSGSFIELYSDLDQILDDEAWEADGRTEFAFEHVANSWGPNLPRRVHRARRPRRPAGRAGSTGRHEPGGPTRSTWPSIGFGPVGADAGRAVRPPGPGRGGAGARHRGLPAAPCRPDRPRGPPDPAGGRAARTRSWPVRSSTTGSPSWTADRRTLLRSPSPPLAPTGWPSSVFFHQPTFESVLRRTVVVGRGRRPPRRRGRRPRPGRRRRRGAPGRRLGRSGPATWSGATGPGR